MAVGVREGGEFDVRDWQKAFAETTEDYEALFTRLWRRGLESVELIVRDGKVVKVVQGATHVCRPEYDRSIEKPLKEYFDRYLTVRMENFRASDEEIVEGGRGQIVVQPTKARTS